MGIFDMFRKTKKDVPSQIIGLLKEVDIVTTAQEITETINQMGKKIDVHFELSNTPPQGELRYQESGWSLTISGKIADVATGAINKDIIKSIYGIAAVMAAPVEIAKSVGRNDAAIELLRTMPAIADHVKLVI